MLLSNIFNNGCFKVKYFEASGKLHMAINQSLKLVNGLRKFEDCPEKPRNQLVLFWKEQNINSSAQLLQQVQAKREQTQLHVQLYPLNKAELPWIKLSKTPRRQMSLKQPGVSHPSSMKVTVTSGCWFYLFFPQESFPKQKFPEHTGLQ